LDPNLTRRQPRQERARFTAAAILRAAVEVIDDVGWAHASTNRIAERAGVSIGSLYQYFDSKETILEKLIEQHHEAVDQVIATALARYYGGPQKAIDDVLRELFRALIRLHREDPVLTRVLASDVPRHRALEAHGVEPERFAGLLKQILEQRPDVRVRETAAAAFILVTTAEALTRWVAHDAPDFLDTDVLIEEIVAMLSGYVTHRYPGERAK
jgi:AcrR family transcriptional regulator